MSILLDEKDGPTYDREDSLEGEAGGLQGILHCSLTKADICTTTGMSILHDEKRQIEEPGYGCNQPINIEDALRVH
jgi:hypothetical protein